MPTQPLTPREKAIIMRRHFFVGTSKPGHESFYMRLDEHEAFVEALCLPDPSDALKALFEKIENDRYSR